MIKAKKTTTKKRASSKLVTYIGIVRDHSGSMTNLAGLAMKDYNEQLRTIKSNTNKKNINFLSVVECGTRNYFNGSQVNPREILADVNFVNEINTYETPGGTPLYDSVGELITQFENIKKVAKTTSFLIVVITDGQELHSKIWGNEYRPEPLASKIKELQATGKWTFAFRVPRGYKERLVKSLGLPYDNVIEWEQTASGFEKTTQNTNVSYGTYFRDRSRGLTASASFFTPDLSNVNTRNLKASLVDVKNEVKFWVVKTDEAVKPFCEKMSGSPFLKGAAFYQLIKTERKVQQYKLIAIRDKINGSVYIGDAARDLLGLPRNGDIALRPDDHSSKYDIYVQSTSVNRKLPAGSNVLYWSNVGKQLKAA